jgi:hypothetical protein
VWVPKTFRRLQISNVKIWRWPFALSPFATGNTIASSLSLAAAFFASAGCFFTGVLLWFELAHTEQENLVGSREERDTREMLGVFFNGFDGF